MLLRFFLAIWLSILLCLAGIIVISRLLGVLPPSDLVAAYQRSAVLDLAEAAIRRNGSADAVAALTGRLVPPAVLASEALSACSPLPEARDLVRYVATADGCLRLTLKDADNRAGALIPPLTIPLIGASLIGLVASLLLARRFKRPVDTLREGFRALSRGDLAARIGGTLGRRRDEMGQLARDFDVMAERLETLSEGRRRLFHDVSHELRSPLARLQATTGVLRQSPAKLGPMLTRIETEIGKLDHLVDEILTLARLDDGAARPLVRSRVDLMDLVAPIVADAAFEGQDRRVGCRYEGPGTIDGDVDPELCHRALENVIRNAIHHTALGTDVEVRAWVSPEAESGPARAVITVEDRGPGVAEAELESIFAPFQHASDLLRMRGAGLGLAIARRAMEVHGGAARATLRAGGGLVVTLDLPLGGFGSR